LAAPAPDGVADTDPEAVLTEGVNGQVTMSASGISTATGGAVDADRTGITVRGDADRVRSKRSSAANSKKKKSGKPTTVN
jgi:hypothetical protein